MSEVVDIPFTIRSPSVPGGYLQFTTFSGGETATFGSGGSTAAQWFMRPAADGVSVLITNQQSRDPIASGGPPDWKIRAGSGHPWYLYPVGASYFAICYDPSCMMVWAPLSLVGNGVPGSNEVVVANAGGLEYEWWEILQVGSPPSSPPPTEPPVVPTTNNGQATTTQVYPRPSSTAPSTNADPGNVQALAQCKPCGNTDCSFTPSGAPSPATYTVLVGQPVENCNAGNQKDVTTKFKAKYELSTSFTVEVTAGVAGLGVFGPSFSTSIASSQEKKTEEAQEVEMQIEPGKVGALLAVIAYSTIPGTMDVGKSSLAFVAVQPGLVLRYTVNYTDCGTDFQALALPKDCSQGSAAASTRVHIVNKGVLFWSFWLIAFILAL